MNFLQNLSYKIITSTSVLLNDEDFGKASGEIKYRNLS